MLKKEPIFYQFNIVLKIKINKKMDYFFPTLTVATLGLAVYNYVAITNYFIRFLLHSPGQGEIIKKVNPKIKTTNYHIKSPEHDFRLNYIKTPCFDLDISFFVNDIEYENSFISISDFEKKYGDEKFYKLPNYGMGVIDDVYNTRNIKKGNLYGFIKIMTENRIYMFTVVEGLIDVKNIFDKYEDELFEDDLDN